MNTDAIANRTVGQYPLSIATSLALESAAGIHPEIIVEKAPLPFYDELWVNCKTLYRNLLGSLDKLTARAVHPEELADAITQEMSVITALVQDLTHGRTRVVYYLSEYAGLQARYPHALLRVNTTPLQKEYTALQDQTLELLLTQHTEDIRVFTLKLTPERRVRTLVLTHCAYDLVSSKAFGELALLESHTGKIKERASWSSKYYDGKHLSQIPFREDLLQVFGDSEHFRPMPSGSRKAVLAIAERYHWSAVTTRDKLRYGIEQLQDPHLKTVLLEMLES